VYTHTHIRIYAECGRVLHDLFFVLQVGQLVYTYVYVCICIHIWGIRSRIYQLFHELFVLRTHVFIYVYMYGIWGVLYMECESRTPRTLRCLAGGTCILIYTTYR
jgi:hypothetical protein